GRRRAVEVRLQRLELVRFAVSARFERAHAWAVEVAFADVVDPVAMAHAQVRHVRMDGRRDIARERPWRRRPHQERFLLALAQRKSNEDRGVLEDPATLGDLHLREASAAATAPRHHVVPAIDEAFVEALLEESPNRVVVLGRKGEVAPAVLVTAELSD